MVNLFPEDPLLLIVAANTHRPIWLSEVKSAVYGVYLITSKVLDARRRGATTEPYEAIRCKPAPAEAGGGAIDGNGALLFCSGP